MKKALLTATLAVAIALTTNAQFYAGGALGFESNSKGGDEPQSLFSLSPEAGYYLNDKFDVGLGLTYSFTKGQDNTKSTVFTFAPYARYSLLQLGKLEVIGKGSLFISFDSEKPDGGSVAKETTFGVGVIPQLAYSINDSFVLFANLNFASFNLSSTSPDEGDSITHFGLGVNTNDVLNTGNLQIGFIYKF